VYAILVKNRIPPPISKVLIIVLGMDDVDFLYFAYRKTPAIKPTNGKTKGICPPAAGKKRTSIINKTADPHINKSEVVGFCVDGESMLLL
jgi:hypothetical protein